MAEPLSRDEIERIRSHPLNSTEERLIATIDELEATVVRVRALVTAFETHGAMLEARWIYAASEDEPGPVWPNEP